MTRSFEDYAEGKYAVTFDCSKDAHIFLGLLGRCGIRQSGLCIIEPTVQDCALWCDPEVSAPYFHKLKWVPTGVIDTVHFKDVAYPYSKLKASAKIPPQPTIEIISNKGTTVALQKSAEGKVLNRAIAKKHPDDTFVYEDGVKVAVQRLFNKMGISINTKPTPFTIEKPDKYRVGDTVIIKMPDQEHHRFNNRDYMSEYDGCSAIIVDHCARYTDEFFHLSIDNKQFSWRKDDFAGVVVWK